MSSTYQRQITDDAARQQRERDRRVWVGARDSIRDALSTLSGPGFEPNRNDLRALLRLVERVDRRVAA